MVKLVNDVHKIVLEDRPLIDLRSPSEYNKGSFYNTVNLPLLTDEERHQVGIAYKNEGNEAAISLGHQLVSGTIKDERMDAWLAQLSKYPDSCLYCFRGGMRSKIVQEWIYETTGKWIPRIKGGYKVFRNYLIKALEPDKQNTEPILLSGNTGTGKTILLNKFDHSIDLEGLANHRGSSFGNYITPQPTQINFENNLAYELIKHKEKRYKHLILEDESIHIGKVRIPKPLFQLFQQSKVILLEIPFEERVQITWNEYVDESQKVYHNHYGNQGLDIWANKMKEGITRIKKRLGALRYQEVITLFDEAYQTQLNTGNHKNHMDWVAYLLKEYYDPMYEYQMKKHTKDIIFKGNTQEVYDYIKTKTMKKQD